MAVWPISFPSQFEVGLRDTRQAGFIRTQTDSGPFKQRRRYTATSRFLSGSMVFTRLQRVDFETFYTSTLNEGADAFSFTDPVDLSTVQARFVRPPGFSALSGSRSGAQQWRATIELEVLP